MRILALNAYHGGSHREFLNGWTGASCHQWTVLTLPPHHWKWRMRHAAITLGQRIIELSEQQSWNAIFCTDMLNLAELPAFVPPAVRDLPRIIYFHENQLTYPDDHAGERDLHFGFTNFTAALAADQVWFNSHFHREVFLTSLREHLKRMPDEQPIAMVDVIKAKSRVESPGVDFSFDPKLNVGPREPGRLRLVWAARWEHDKGPDLLFDALRQLKASGVGFEISVLGESFKSVPACFEIGKRELANEIKAWGFAKRADYQRVLDQADVFISTARHEFFGIAAVEAAAAGCIPAVPRALAYPEVLGESAVMYEPDNATSLVDAIRIINDEIERDGVDHRAMMAREQVKQYSWKIRASKMDDAIEAVCRKTT